MTTYRISDLDVTDFANDWLLALDLSTASMLGLLEHVDEGYNFGALFMMANIGPRATETGAIDDELVLYAALAAFQNARYPGMNQWEGTRRHLDAAFAHANSLGRAGVARNLLKRLAEDSRQDDPEWLKTIRSRSHQGNPARLAAHDRDMASLLARDVRAAHLLDPTASLDEILLQG